MSKRHTKIAALLSILLLLVSIFPLNSLASSGDSHDKHDIQLMAPLCTRCMNGVLEVTTKVEETYKETIICKINGGKCRIYDVKYTTTRTCYNCGDTSDSVRIEKDVHRPI